MTYEQLLDLEDRNGRISKGLLVQEIKQIGYKICYQENNQEACSICYEDVKRGQKIRELLFC